MRDPQLDTAFRHWWSKYATLSNADPRAWEPAGDRLLVRHQESHRRYHGVRHIVNILEVLSADLELPKPLPASVVLAAFFHDAIYDPRAADNEAASAVLARGELNRLWIKPEVITHTLAMIEATAIHEPDGTPHCAAFLDADLSILGASPDIYRQYAEGIREEYAHVPADDFRSGRARILEGFLKRESLFFTPAAQQAFEAQARVNIAEELSALTGTESA